MELHQDFKKNYINNHELTVQIVCRSISDRFTLKLGQPCGDPVNLTPQNFRYILSY